MKTQLPADLSNSVPSEDPRYVYPLSFDDSTELARAACQDRFFTMHLGGVLPEQERAQAITSLLDVGCGPGGWLLDVAHAYPKTEAVGIDLSKMMIEYANGGARSQGLDNARFMVMDALQPLEFDDESFDLVNARYISLFVPGTYWPAFMRECLRVTVPGGMIRLTEWERPITTSLAVETLYTMLIHALKERDLASSPDGQHLSHIALLGRRLREAGCGELQSKIYELDFSAGSQHHETGYLHFMVTFQLLKDLLLRQKLLTPAAFTELYQQALLDIMSMDYCSLLVVRTVWGKKASLSV